MKLRLAKASQMSWSWGLPWLSLAISGGWKIIQRKKKRKLEEPMKNSTPEIPGVFTDHEKVKEETIGKDGVSSEEKTVKNTRGLSQEAVEKLDDGNSALWATMCGYHKKTSCHGSWAYYTHFCREMPHNSMV